MPLLKQDSLSHLTRLTSKIKCHWPAVPPELLALVPSHRRHPLHRRSAGVMPNIRETTARDMEPIFGDVLKEKESYTLRIGFQNIGGFTLDNSTLKDELLREGANTFELDILGMARILYSKMNY
jgi:hypothetical protein